MPNGNKQLASPPHAEIVAGKKINKVVSDLYFDTIFWKLQKKIKIMTFQSFLDLSSNRSWATQQTLLPDQLFYIPRRTSFNQVWAKPENWCSRLRLYCLNFALQNKVQHVLTQLTQGQNNKILIGTQEEGKAPSRQYHLIFVSMLPF